MINLEISLFYHLRQKAGASPVYLSVAEGTTVQQVKDILEIEYPRLTTQLDNVLILKGKEIILEVRQDPGLIGGIVTRIGDLILDGSIKTQLLNMRETLKRGESA